MMKKQYIIPETEIYLIKSNEICIATGSGDANGGSGPGGDNGQGFGKDTDWEDEDWEDED